jgi:predicted site-specific integrase-resolvase
MDQYVSCKEVQKVLKVHYQTLYRMEQRGEIDVVKIGKRRMYNLSKFLRTQGVDKNNKKKKICYCRISNKKQKDDLAKQIEFMKENYKNYDVIGDIGSGLDMKRPGLSKIIEMAINGEVEELVVAYKDRLARFNYDLIEHLIEKYSKGKIIVINNTEEKTPNDELVKDMTSIMNIYSPKINGLKKYKKQIKEEIKKN